MKKLKDRARKGGDLLTRAIPIIGDAIENRRNENGKPKGKIDWEGVIIFVVRAAVFLSIFFMIFL